MRETTDVGAGPDRCRRVSTEGTGSAGPTRRDHRRDSKSYRLHAGPHLGREQVGYGPPRPPQDAEEAFERGVVVACKPARNVLGDGVAVRRVLRRRDERTKALTTNVAHRRRASSFSTDRPAHPPSCVTLAFSPTGPRLSLVRSSAVPAACGPSTLCATTPSRRVIGSRAVLLVGFASAAFGNYRGNPSTMTADG